MLMRPDFFFLLYRGGRINVNEEFLGILVFVARKTSSHERGGFYTAGLTQLI